MNTTPAVDRQVLEQAFAANPARGFELSIVCIRAGLVQFAPAIILRDPSPAQIGREIGNA